MGIRTEEQEHSRVLHIARDTYNSNHGEFLKSLCFAFMKADPLNFEILREPMELIVRKYGLKCTCSIDSPDRLPDLE